MEQNEHAVPEQEPAAGETLRIIERFFARLGEETAVNAGASNGEVAEIASWSLGLLHAAHDVVYAFSLSPSGLPGTLLDVNGIACRFFGYTREELRRMTLYDLIDPERTDLAVHLRTISAQRHALFEADHRAKDGRLLPLKVHTYRFMVHGQELVLAVGRHVSARWTADAAQAHLAAIVESSEDAIIGKTLEGEITSWNAAAERMYGYTAEEILGQSIMLIAPPDRRGEIQRILRALARGERIRPFETVRRAKDGRLIDIALSVSPICDAAGTVIGASAIARDITPRKDVLRALRRREAQQAAVARLGLQAVEGASLADLIDALVHSVAEQLGVEYCKVLELLPGRDGLRLIAGVGWQHGLVGQAVVGIDQDSQAGYTLSSDAPVIVYDLRSEARFNGPALLRDHGVVSGLSVPIMGIGGQPYGVLGAHTRRKVKFTGDDVNFIQAVANLLGEAIARKRTEEALKEREASYRALVQAIPDALFVLSQDAVFIDVIPADDMKAVAATDYLGRSVEDVLPVEVAGLMLQHLHRVQETGSPQGFEFSLDRDGSTVYLEARLVPRGDGQTLSIVRDITGRKTVEDRLRAEYTLRRAIETSMPAGVAATDLAGRQIYVNPAFCKMVGWREDELIGETAPFCYWPPEEMDAIQQAFEETLQGKASPEGVELRFMRRDGQRFDVLVAVAPLTDRDGCTEGFLASVTDISERRAAEMRNRFHASILSQVNDAVVAIDTEQRVTFLNDSFADMVGLDDETALGKPLLDLYGYRWLNPEDAETAFTALAGSGHWQGEVVLQPREGQEINAEFSVSVLTDGAGREIGKLAVIRDVSERKRAEQRTRFLSEATTALATSLQYEETLRAVAGLVVPALADWCAVHVVTPEGAPERVAVMHADPEKIQLAEELQARYPLDPEASYGVPLVIRTGQSAFMPEVDDALLREAAHDEDHYRILVELGLHSALVVPLVARGRSLGALTLVHAESGRRFTEEDQTLAEELARRCALSVDNARLFRDAEEEIAERKRAQEALRESDRLLRFTLEAARVGTWNWDLATNAVQWSDNLEVIHRLRRGSFDGTFGAFLADVAAEDRETVHQAIQQALTEGGAYHVEYRLPSKEEHTVWIEGKGTVIFDEAGQPVRMAGICMDITERKQAELALREKTHTLETINRINTSLAAQLDLDRLVEAVTDAGTELSGAAFGAFFYNVGGGMDEPYTPYTRPGVPREALDDALIPYITPILASTFKGEGIVRLDDLTQDARFAEDLAQNGIPAGQRPVRSCLAVPVIGHGGEVLGGLFFGHSETHVFTAQDEEVIDGIAAQAAIAIENARLYDAVRRELAVRKKAEALVGIQKRILEHIAQGAPLPDVLDLLVRALEEQAEGDLLASILLLDEDGRHLLHGAAPNLPAAYNAAIDGIEIGEGVGSCGTAAFRKEAVVVTDIAKDPLWSDFRDLALRHGLHACWSTPIFDTRSHTLGTFALYYPVPREPSPAHRQLISIMTRTASIAIERHRDERKLRELNETLELKVAERTAALEGANEQLTREVADRRRAEKELEEANTRLRQRNRELQDFAYAASHDLQEPLRKISTFADLLRVDYGPRLDEEGLFFLERMQNASQRMSGLITDLLAFSRVATQGRAFETLDLRAVVEGVLGDLEIGISQVGGRIEIGELPSLEADPMQMRQLIQNLVANAIKFSKEDVPPVVRLRGSIEEGPDGQPMARLEVEDNGIGFDEKYRDRIFSPFQRLHGRSEYPGSGIGLALCRRIVERHGGTITAHSEPGKGSVFEILLPVHHVADERVE